MSFSASHFEADDSRPALAGRQVLVVESEKAVCNTAVEILSPYGCEVAIAESGADALAVVAQRGACGAFDALLVALRLPDVIGTDLLNRLRDRGISKPAAMISGFGYDFLPLMTSARRAGLRTIIHKPFRRDQLLDAVEQLLAPSSGSAPFAASASRRHG
jgi:CheY-like chemotaxis protein